MSINLIVKTYILSNYKQLQKDTDHKHNQITIVYKILLRLSFSYIRKIN